MDIKARLRNKAFLLSLVAFLVLVIKTFTKIELPANFDTLVDMLLTILVGLGVVINPLTEGITDKE